MAALPEADRQDDAEPSPAPPFAAPDAGGDYFGTEAHYQALAGRIITRLRAGPGFVFLTGDPPPDPRRLAPALMNAAAAGYAVGVVTCGPELNREQLLRAAPPSGAPLFVFDGVDGLADGQLNSLCEALASGDGVKPAAVLLAHPNCVTRLERLQPRLVKEGLASRLHFNELARDEVETFIRRQLPTDEQPVAFTAEAIAAIVDFSGGDPGVVNRLALLIASFPQPANSRGAKKPEDATPETEEAPRPSLEALALERRRRSRHRGAEFLAGILLCLAIVGFALMPADEVASVSAWLTPLYKLISTELAYKRPASRPDPAPSAPIVAATAIAPAGPQPPAAETIETGPATPPSAAPVAAPVEPKPAPAAAETIEARAITPPAPAPVTAPMEPQPSIATASPPPAPELPLTPRSSAAETAALVTRGDAFVSMRDIASARLYYERAAEMGDGRGALRMGETFDPAFLARAGIRGARGDEQQALSWYRRARNLGDAEVDRLLKDLELHQP